MILSNLRPSFLLALICVFFAGCGSSPRNENTAVSLAGETKSEFPFSTREPEVYQADFVESDGRTETTRFMARKGDKWRVDVNPNDGLNRTTVNSDYLYHIDHKRKIYVVEPLTELSRDGLAVNFLLGSFFGGREYREFDEIGREGNIVKYKVRDNQYSHDDIVISVDQSSGMVVRQEFRGQIGNTEAGSQVPFIFELRNLRLEVDDSVFQIPDGYRKVTEAEYRAPVAKPGR